MGGTMTAASKKMKNDIKTKSERELGDMLISLRREQLNLRFQGATGQVTTSSRIQTIRKDIARIQTQLTALKSASAKK